MKKLNLLSSRLLPKNVKIRMYKTNFTCGSVCVWKQGAENILAQELQCDGKVEKTA
jgi:hypothetical protein